MNADHATAADYLRIGIELGLVEPQRARDWADAVIRAEEAPAAEIIEVSWSLDMPALIRSLCTVPGEGDRVLAGQWLLADLGEALGQCDDERLDKIVRQCLAVCVAAGLDEETYYRFDTIDDELSLARLSAYGTVGECREALVDLLAAYPCAPRVGVDADRTTD